MEILKKILTLSTFWFYCDLKTSKHYIRTDQDIDLTTDLGNSSLVSWHDSHSACEELCNHAVGKHTNDSVAKYGKISGKCECFRVPALENFDYNPISESQIYSFDRELNYVMYCQSIKIYT